MPTAQISVQVEFCAAFRLEQPAFTDEQNMAAFGPCFSKNFHGHNYKLKVFFMGEIDPQTGMVADYSMLERLLQEQVVEHVNHRNLNLDVPFLRGLVPTSENLCVAFWPRISGGLPSGLTLVEVELSEDRRFGVRYRGPESQE